MPILQSLSMQHPLSTINVKSTIQRRGTPEVEVQKEAEVLEVKKEAEATSGQSATSL
jgi:hypothetical protein